MTRHLLLLSLLSALSALSTLAAQTVTVTVTLELTTEAHAKVEEYRANRLVDFIADNGNLIPTPRASDVEEMFHQHLAAFVEEILGQLPTALVQQKIDEAEAARKAVEDEKRRAVTRVVQ